MCSKPSDESLGYFLSPSGLAEPNDPSELLSNRTLGAQTCTIRLTPDDSPELPAIPSVTTRRRENTRSCEAATHRVSVSLHSP